MVHEFTDANFQSEVIANNQLTVVDCWAEWCGPCRAIAPVMTDLAKDYEGVVKIGKLDVDHNPNTSVAFGITAIPTVLFFKGGKIVDKQIGAVPKAMFDKKIKSNL